jgi:hypothetical protein
MHVSPHRGAAVTERTPKILLAVPLVLIQAARPKRTTRSPPQDEKAGLARRLIRTELSKQRRPGCPVGRLAFGGGRPAQSVDGLIR